MALTMRILHLAKHESSGAGRAALRLHQGLLDIGMDSHALVNEKTSRLSSVSNTKLLSTRLTELEYILADKFLSKRLSPSAGFFSINVTPSLFLKQIAAINPDVINLHWVGSEFIRIEALKKLKVPLIWTLQDMWPFTGGCHYSENCDRYTASCGQCPQLKTVQRRDLSSSVWHRKHKAWENLDLTVVAPSSWIADCARKSSLFGSRRIETISFGLNTNRYKPIDQKVARQALGLPADKQLILFGALRATDDPRKGFHLLQPALQKINRSVQTGRFACVVFGSSTPENPPDLGCETHYLGHLNDDLSLSLAYAAADVMVVPSIQESFGQTASEALACGTPVVAFNATGLLDIVDHQYNGYLAQPYDVDDLAQGLLWVLAHPSPEQTLRKNSREKAETAFQLETQARTYQTLYSDIRQASKAL
jgi:glycosyltransferase involved in cell wall biosynthesis